LALHREDALTHPDRKGGEEMANQGRRYGSKGNGRGIPLTDYHQSRDNAAEFPPTTNEKIPVTNLPNVFSYRSHVFSKKPELVQRFIKATKADVGGVGGHVVAADEVKGVPADQTIYHDRTRPSRLLVPIVPRAQ